MNHLKNFDIYFFFLVLFVATGLVVWLLLPFSSAIFVSVLLALMFNKPYNFFLKVLKSKVISSFLACILVAITIVFPFFLVGGLVFKEVSSVAINLTDGKTIITQEKIENVISLIYEFKVLNFSLSQFKKSFSKEEISSFIKNTMVKFLDYFQETSKSIANGFVWIFVMFFSLFYFFIDGNRFVTKLMRLSPLKDRHEKLLISKFVSMSRATLKGTLIIGAIQGSIGGLAFLIAGIPSPIIWMTIMVLISIIPALGASFVLILASPIMFFLGNFWQGIFLLSVGIFVSVIDNFLRPKLIGKDTQMHGLLVFFATLGGSSAFGLIGFIVGPIVMALGIALWEIYAVEFKSDLRDYNEG